MKRRYHKLTEAEFTEIVALYLTGCSAKQLAAQFDVDRMNISRRLRRIGVSIRGKTDAARRGHKAWNLGKPLPALRGANHWNWQGGRTTWRVKIMKSLEYKNWRRCVFERDKYTCVNCGDSRGGNLNADHIKSFADYPDLRFEVSNGRTLCEPCHRKTPSYLNTQSRNQHTKSGLAR
jgi:hypothetical protein